MTIIKANYKIQAIFRPQYIEGSAPEYATPGSSGMDLRADIEDALEIFPAHGVLVRTGLYLNIDLSEIEAQVRSRSGLALKKGLVVLNSPGTIDSDYQQEIGVILFNHGTQAQWIRPGDRIAQLVFCPVIKVALELTEAFDIETGRGGFGSTGI